MNTGRMLLAANSLVSLVLGVSLVLFHKSVALVLGVPVPASPFYAWLLGAVLLLIGIALAFLCLKPPAIRDGPAGDGAMVANVVYTGAVALAWLLLATLQVPIRGYLVLWSLSILLLGITAVGLVGRVRKLSGSAGAEERSSERFFELTIRIPKPTRRWLQFRLRTLFLFILIVALVAAWRVSPYRPDGSAVLFSYSNYRDQDKATFSFKHGIRDDPGRVVDDELLFDSGGGDFLQGERSDRRSQPAHRSWRDDVGRGPPHHASEAFQLQ